MKRLALVSVALSSLQTCGAFADSNVYSGPFYMCPDAHGADQKGLFRTIDITNMPMRIEGMGQRRIDGFSASLSASRSAVVMNQKDPIEEAFERLSGVTTTMAEDDRRLVAVCFALEPPPSADIDGPFLFMPGYFVDTPGDVIQPFDTIVVPEQTYLVLTFTGSAEDVGNMRFTLTEEFWPKVAPFLGLERVDGPNLMIWPPGFKGNEAQVSLEMWTPIKPYRISPP